MCVAIEQFQSLQVADIGRRFAELVVLLIRERKSRLISICISGAVRTAQPVVLIPGSDHLLWASFVEVGRAAQTSSALPASTNGFASDHRRITMSLSLPSMVTSESTPRPSTKISLSRRIKTAASRSGASTILMPAASLRFCS